MELLITPEEVKRLGRPIGNVEESKIKAFIREAEHLSVKPVIGDELYLKLLDKGETEEDYKTLLNGGSYSDSKGNVFSFMGLRVAISYYVYAQNVMSGDFESTRYGMVLKDSDYSSRMSSKERSDCYNITGCSTQHQSCIFANRFNLIGVSIKSYNRGLL